MKQEYRDLLKQDIQQQRYRDLLYKDLSGRLPYNVVINCTEDDDETVNFNCLLTPSLLDNIISSAPMWIYKPYLRSMEDMTEEEDKEFALLQVQGGIDEDKYLYACDAANMINWLNKHHFDYRGLIDKGIVLRAPKGMY